MPKWCLCIAAACGRLTAFWETDLSPLGRSCSRECRPYAVIRRDEADNITQSKESRAADMHGAYVTLITIIPGLDLSDDSSNFWFRLAQTLPPCGTKNGEHVIWLAAMRAMHKLAFACQSVPAHPCSSISPLRKY